MPDNAALFDLLTEAGARLAAELDTERLAQVAVEAAIRLIDAEVGAFFERIPAEHPGTDDSWRLSNLAGAPLEAFAPLGTPRVTDLFAPTFARAEIVRSDDIMADPRSGSLGGMPDGHIPVRSYLAIPVIARSGERLGVLLFGHAQPGRFREREQRLATGFATHAAAAIENARLFRSVQREQDRFRAAVQAVRGVLWTNDAQGRMVGEQPAWTALTGQTEAEYAGYGWADALHPDDAGPTVDAWNQAVAERRLFVFEHRVRRFDGVWRAFVIRAVPVLEADGSVREWVGVHTDITEQREAEADLRESNAELQRYAYVISHDLRSPLVNIMGFTGELAASRDALLEAGALPQDDPRRIEAIQEFDEALGFVRAASSKMDRLIGAILKLAREGRRNFRPEPLDMGALIQGIADAQRHQADAAEAEFMIGPLPDLVADRLAVEQVFGNLLDNALKYLVPSRPGRIEVTGSRRGNRVIFTVRDNGRGVAPEDHSRVFELFRRAGKQDRPGEGIGLAHVRSLVRAMGGRIEIASQLGAGTAFTITWPHAPAAAG